MSRIRRLRQFAFLSLASVLISCGSDNSPTAIQAAINTIQISLGLSNLVVGQTVQANAIAHDAAGTALTGVTITWSSANTSVATVTSAGLVTAVAPGTTQITGSAEGFSGSATVTVVPVPVAAVAVSLSASAVTVGQQVTATATTRDGSNNLLTGRVVTWSSSNTAVATVSATGLVTAVSVGTTNIVATSEGITGNAPLTVQAPTLGSVAVALTTTLLEPGQTTSAAATLRDASNNVVTGVPVTWTSTNSGVATVSPTGTVTAVSVGSTLITATAAGVSGNAALSVQPAVGSVSVAFATNPIGVAGTSAATATVRDASNNILVGRTVTWSSSNTAVATVSATGLVTGVAIGTATMTATCEGVLGTAIMTIATQPATVVVALSSPSIQLGQSTQATDTVRDANSLILTGQIVTWASSNPIVATVSATGLVTSNRIGTTVISATTSNNIVGQATLTVVAVPPPIPAVPTQLGLLIAPSPSAQTGVAFAQQPTIQLLSAQGNPVAQAGVVVTVAIATGAGTLGGTLTATTNSSGQAAFTNLSISGAVGARTLSFTSTGLTSVNSGTITITAGAATQLSITTQPAASAQNGAAFAPQPVVQLLDAASNAVSQSGVVVTAAIATGGATLGGTLTATTNGSGVATFTNLSITGTAGARTLSFSAAGLTGVTSSTVTITAGAATQLSITTQPSASAQTGVAFGQQPVIQLLDASNNTVSQSGVVVTAAVATGGGTLGGAVTATTNGSGTATFTNLNIVGSGAQTLTFTATGLTAAPSGTVLISATAATQLTITTQPSASAAAAAAFGQQPAIQLRDGSNLVVTQAGVVVTAAIATGGGTLGGTVTATTNASGLATFTNLSISGTIGGRTLTFTGAGLTSATSGTVTVTPGAASQLSITTQPSAATQNAVAFAQQPVIQLLDASSNVVSQAGVVVTAAVATGGAALGGTLTATTNGSGVATFTNLVITGTIGARTIGFAAPALTGATSGTVTVSAGAATKLSITTQPSTTSQNAIAFAQQPVVQLLDVSSNAVSQAGIVVTAAIATGGVALGGTTTATTDVNGTATFTNLAITGTIGARTIGFSAPTLTGATSGTVTISAGAASQLSITTGPPASTQTGVTFIQSPVIQLLDVSGNTVAQGGVVVTASIASGGGVIGGTLTATTTGGGAATFNNLNITGIGAQTLNFAAPSVTPVVSASFTVTGVLNSVGIAPTTGTRVGGASIPITATPQDALLNPIPGLTITWNSTNTGVATVNSSGVVTAVGPGTTNITASTGGKTSPVSTITVVPALTGNIADQSSLAVGGGTVEIYSGTTIVNTATVAGNGTYAVPALAPGTYGVMFEPILSYSMGPAEPTQQPLTISASQSVTATQAFSVQPAMASDDFNSPAYTTAQLLGGCGLGSVPLGDFWHGTNQEMAACLPQIGTITMDPTGGNSTGPAALRYDWFANGTGGNLYLGPRISPIPVLTNLWVRWTSKESAGFAHGGNGAMNAQNQYKFFLIQVGSCPSGCAQFGTYLNNTNAGLGVDPTSVSIDQVDRLGNSTPENYVNIGSSWSGRYHTWVAGMTGLGTTNCTFTLYMDGVPIDSVNGPFSPGVPVGGGGGGLIFLLMGANINNGPDLAQSRWFREVGVYTTRPSLRALPP